jgi:ribosomal protein S18 acetylase RimI-like enzyme
MFFRGPTSIHVVPLTLEQVGTLTPIASGYETNRVFHLSKQQTERGIDWSLRERELEGTVHKLYDDGHGTSWLETYSDAGPPESLHFLGAERSGRVEGLATWTVSNWNASLWLVDIRVRAECRGRGMGSALMDELVALCRKEDLRGIFVETQVQNYPAVCFYRRHGFTIAGFNDHLYTNQDLANQDVALYLFREA